MRKTLGITFSLVALFTLLPASALAVCPVCAVAVGAGLGLSRWLGIDDTISGIWIARCRSAFIPIKSGSSTNSVASNQPHGVRIRITLDPNFLLLPSPEIIRTCFAEPCFSHSLGIRTAISNIIKAFEDTIQTELIRVRWEEIKRLQAQPVIT